MSEGVTGDMAAAVEAAFSASTPDATAGTPAPSTPAATAPAEVPVAAAAEPTPTPLVAEEGPVPYPRFKEVNEKAKAFAKEVETLAWAKGIKAEHAPHLAAFYAKVTQNPLAVLEEADHLLQNPATSPAVKSWAARVLGQRVSSQPDAPQEMAEPTPDIRFEDGTTAFSAERQKQYAAWLNQQWEKRLDAKLNPLQEQAKLTQQDRAEAMYAKIQAESRSAGAKEVEAMKAQPHFEELRPLIRERMLADDTLSLREAYAQAFIETIVPKLSTQQAATLQHKAGASSANPSRPSGAAPGPATDFKTELERVFAAR